MTIKLVSLYLLVNIIVFHLYGIDKRKAVHHKWRIPEKALMLSAVFGVLGALTGMYVFHHKTQKPLFYIGVPVILVLEMLLIVLTLQRSCVKLF